MYAQDVALTLEYTGCSAEAWIGDGTLRGVSSPLPTNQRELNETDFLILRSVKEKQTETLRLRVAGNPMKFYSQTTKYLQ